MEKIKLYLFKNIKKIINCSRALKNIYVSFKIRKGFHIIDQSIAEMSSIIARHNKSIDDNTGSIIILTIPGIPSSAVVDSMLCAGITERAHRPIVFVYDETKFPNVTSEFSLIDENSIISQKFKKITKTLNIIKICEIWKKSSATVLTLSEEAIKYNHKFKDYSNLKIEEIFKYTHKGANIGQHVKAGVIRYYANTSLAHESKALEVAREYLKAAIKVYDVLEEVCKREKAKIMIVPNGIYVPAGVAQSLCIMNEIRFTCWNIAYRERCVIFSHDDTYHHTLLDEENKKWENMNMSSNMIAEISSYLNGRTGYGNRDWIAFNRNQVALNKSDAIKELNIKSEKIVTILTNVNWDAQLHYPSNVFKSMGEWIDITLDLILLRPDVHFIVRIHPAEISGDIPTRESVNNQIRKKFNDNIPLNLTVVLPESTISTYSLCDISCAVIIYGTKTGVELVAKGIPVIVCGEAWIRGKGLTLDVDSKEQYKNLFMSQNFPGGILKPDIDRALKYAYHFFLRRMIFLKCFHRTGGEPRVSFKPTNNNNLFEDDIGYKTIIDSILYKKDFISDQLN